MAVRTPAGLVRVEMSTKSRASQVSWPSTDQAAVENGCG